MGGWAGEGVGRLGTSVKSVGPGRLSGRRGVNARVGHWVGEVGWDEGGKRKAVWRQLRNYVNTNPSSQSERVVRLGGNGWGLDGRMGWMTSGMAKLDRGAGYRRLGNSGHTKPDLEPFVTNAPDGRVHGQARSR
jgi:hypothetical protein